MPKTKYKEYYQKMVDENKKLFNEFMDIHDQYSKNPGANQDEFNRVGRDVLDVVRDFERRLCCGMSKSYGQYSYRLADKFKEVIKKDFPLFDMIGVKVKK